MLRTIGRRQFLVGAGGAVLALPTLSSALPRAARAAPPPRRLVIFFTMHGGARTEAMYPADGTKQRSLELYPGHAVRWGNLALEKSNGRASLSRVLSASSSAFTDTIAARMNLLQGLDIMYYMGHNQGVPLGNFGNEFELKAGIPPMEASIDQVAAQSPAFYPDIAAIRQRSITVVQGTNIDRLSYRWSVGNDHRSGATKVAPERDALGLFNKVFVSGMQQGKVPNDGLLVDQVLEAYKAVRRGAFGRASMLSSEDRRLLDAHMDRLGELQRKLQAVPARSCGSLARPRSSGGKVGNAQLWNEVIAAAFLCNTCRVAALKHSDVFTAGWSGSWHQDIVHQAAVNDGAHEWVVKHNQAFFENVYLDMVRRLDVPDGNGRTVLDNSLVLWTMESGPVTHDNDSTPAVCAGSAGGYFKTGMLVDYRNMKRSGYKGGKTSRAPGLPYNRWLATILHAMGVPAAEWERPGRKGYGNLKNSAPGIYNETMLADASTPLPVIT